MLRNAAVAVFSTLLIAQAGAGAGTDWKPVAKALDEIQTAAGMSVLKRVDECHFAILKDASFVETRNVAWPQYDAQPGETVLKLEFKLPLYKGEPPADNEALPAIWLIDHGKATALSHWASMLQTKPIPMGYEKRLDC